MGRLKVGDEIPQFELKSSSGQTVRSRDLLGKGPVVIYFYPHDDTPGCTAQACIFRDLYQDLKEAGAEVVGISSSTVESHKKFAQTHNLPFILLSDEGGKVREQFGVPRSLGLLPGRVTYVVGPTGKVLYIFNSQTKVEEHVERALEFIKGKKDRTDL
ncbi:MAG: peroxiredoxin [Candidatus Thermoplasmatota archaeon]|jgi:peroxiredoxin Q/BCP|nr:peroxiredoxin [Candidatus Thermoplasmatota archaeon]